MPATKAAVAARDARIINEEDSSAVASLVKSQQSSKVERSLELESGRVLASCI